MVWGVLFGLAAWHFTSTIRALKQPTTGVAPSR
jgi:hypothetical protein